MSGRLLSEVDSELVNEVLATLLGGRVSPAFFVPSRDEAVRIAERLRSARIASRCDCGQSNCKTYRFEAPARPEGVEFRNVRLMADGEMRLVVDADGEVYDLERLSATSPGRRFETR